MEFICASRERKDSPVIPVGVTHFLVVTYGRVPQIMSTQLVTRFALRAFLSQWLAVLVGKKIMSKTCSNFSRFFCFFVVVLFCFYQLSKY